MTAAIPTILCTVAFALGGVVAWLLREREIGELRSGVAHERARSAEVVVQLSKAESNAAEARALLGAERESFERERAGLEAKLLGQFQNLAQQALGQASSTFLELASTKLAEERQAVKGVVAPVHEEFLKFSQAVSGLQKSTSEDLGALKNSLAHVVQLQAQLQEAVRTTNDATGQLRTALQNPRVAGNWGEISLERIVELAGMTEHCDFDRQTGIRSLDGTQERPDVTVHLTGGLHIPLDAKTSAANYIRAFGDVDEDERAKLLKQSAVDLRSRVTELRNRSYDRIDGYAGMTILFVPNESMLSSALTQEPGLLEEAVRYHIVICSPLLLFCYLQAFANGWRVQKQQDNAQEVARRGKTLYDRLRKFFVAVGDVGRALDRTVDKFNDVVRKTDNVLVPGRELGKLLGEGDDLPVIESIDTSVREVRNAIAGP
jgi:DNA recombination protein RmuC